MTQANMGPVAEQATLRMRVANLTHTVDWLLSIVRSQLQNANGQTFAQFQADVAAAGWPTDEDIWTNYWLEGYGAAEALQEEARNGD